MKIAKIIILLAYIVLLSSDLLYAQNTSQCDIYNNSSYEIKTNQTISINETFENNLIKNYILSLLNKPYNNDYYIFFITIIIILFFIVPFISYKLGTILSIKLHKFKLNKIYVKYVFFLFFIIFINYIFIVKLLSNYEEKLFCIIPLDLRAKILTENNIKLLDSLTKTTFDETIIKSWNSPNCLSNMKTIEGAVELYQMENGTNNNIQIEDLVNNGYLKKLPKCPKNKSKLNIIKYKLIKNKKFIDVECSIHGKFGSQETTDKMKEL